MPLSSALILLPIFGCCCGGFLSASTTVGSYARLGFIFPYLFSGILPALLVTWAREGRYWGWIGLFSVLGAHAGVCASHFLTSFAFVDCLPGLILLMAVLPPLQFWISKLKLPVSKALFVVGVVSFLVVARDFTERYLERSERAYWASKQTTLLSQWQGWADQVLLPAYRVKLRPDRYEPGFGGHFSGKKGPVTAEAWTAIDGQQSLNLTSENKPIRDYVEAGALSRISDESSPNMGTYYYSPFDLPPQPWIMGGGNILID